MLFQNDTSFNAKVAVVYKKYKVNLLHQLKQNLINNIPKKTTPVL